MNKAKYDVSALIISYRPNYEKLIMTIRSFLLQEDISLQIIVADDGSENDCFTELEAFFSKCGFTDYMLVKNPVNQGIVKNFLSGLNKCEGVYVKPLSPGDYICSSTALREWITYMEQECVSVCGASYFCYHFDSENKFVALKEKVHPRISRLEGSKRRMDYLINEDLFLGAATLCRRELLMKYVSMLEGKVKYAEDNCYRIMAYCAEPMGFYDKEMILYEVGTGVSTSKEDKWGSLLRKDWSAADNIMLNMETEDRKMKKQFKTFIDMKNTEKRSKIFGGGARAATAAEVRSIS